MCFINVYKQSSKQIVAVLERSKFDSSLVSKDEIINEVSSVKKLPGVYRWWRWGGLNQYNTILTVDGEFDLDELSPNDKVRLEKAILHSVQEKLSWDEVWRRCFKREPPKAIA